MNRYLNVLVHQLTNSDTIFSRDAAISYMSNFNSVRIWIAKAHCKLPNETVGQQIKLNWPQNNSFKKPDRQIPRKADHNPNF